MDVSRPYVCTYLFDSVRSGRCKWPGTTLATMKQAVHPTCQCRFVPRASAAADPALLSSQGSRSGMKTDNNV